MQIMLGEDETGRALALLNLSDRRGEADALYRQGISQDTGLGNWWAVVAQYVSAPPKGGTQVVRSRQSGIKPETVAMGALAAVAAYLALG